MVAHAEDVEIDYMVEWQKERLKAKSAKVLIDENGMPKMTEQGVPLVTISPEDELKAYTRLYQLGPSARGRRRPSPGPGS
jgi:hypothetical protein